MIKIDFDFGIEYNADGNPIRESAAHLAIIRLTEELSKLTGGCSYVSRIGSWFDPDVKRLITELGFTLSTVAANDDCVAPIVESIKRRLNQKCVAVTKTPVTFEIL